MRAVVDPRLPAPLRELRQARALSLHKLADQTFFSKSYLGHLESGTRTPTVKTAIRLDEVLDAGGEWAQFTSWLNLSGEGHAAALKLLDQALEWAIEVDDTEMVATILSFKGHSAWLRREPGPLVGLTEAALRNKSVYIGQRAYDMLQLARGQALAGDMRVALDSLATADDLIAEAAEFTGAAPPWQYYRTPGFFTMERGLVHAVLGQHDPTHDEQAVTLLRDGLAALNGDGADWAAIYACHLVEVYLRRGDRTAAVELLERVRRVAVTTQSPRLAARICDFERAARRLSVSTRRTQNE